MKKLVSLLLALMMLGGVALAESDINTIAGRNAAIGYPVVDAPVSVEIAVVPQGSAVEFDAEKNWMCQYMSRYSGLDITWKVIEPTTAKERVSVMLNSGDMPECILGYGFNALDVVQYGVSNGVFRPINDLIEYMPNLSKLMEDGATRAEMTAPDGNIYGFPAFNNIYSYDHRFFINQEWLKNVGMENPTTLQELKDVLIAFRDQDANGNGDPSDEIPWSDSWSGTYKARVIPLMAYGFIPKDEMIALQYGKEETTIEFMPLTAEYKEYLLYMNDLWKEKLLDPDAFTQAETQVQANTLEGIVGFASMASPETYIPHNKEAYISINPLVAREGQTPVYPGKPKVWSPAKMVLNADIAQDKAIALAKLADTMYTLGWYMLALRGPELNTELDWNQYGHYFDETANTLSSAMPENMPNFWSHIITNLSIWELPGFNLNGHVGMYEEMGRLYPETAYGSMYKDGMTFSHLDSLMITAYADYYVDPVPNFYFAAEDLERVNELTVPLQDYVTSMEAKFITGDLDIETEYPQYLEKLKEYGAEELLEIYTQYYEAYKAN